MLSRSRLIIPILILASTSLLQAATYKLQAVRSKEIYGPFSFKTDTYVKIESGIFQLKILSGRTFKFVSSDTGKTYGVYELLPSRIIDVGDVLFSITDIKVPRSTAAAPGARSNVSTERVQSRSVFTDTALGLEFDVLNTVAYDWSINGADGADAEDMERNAVSLRFKRKFLTGRLGLVTAADWDNTVSGGSNTFQNAEIVEGTGWFAGLGVEIPIIEDGRWKAKIFGEIAYRQESLSLEYSEDVISIVSTTVTNGISNIVTTATSREITYHSDDADLTEIITVLGATVSYEAPAWFVYAGLKVLPWEDTSLDASVTVDGSSLDIELERNDPVMGYGGIGFFVANTKCYVEVVGGGETAVRLGLIMEL